MPKTKILNKTCPICNKQFMTIGYRDGQRKTCSKECANIKRSKVRDIPEVIRQYESGISANKIAKSLGVADVTILKILKDNNIPRRDNNDPVYNRSKKKKNQGSEVKIDWAKLNKKVEEISRREATIGNNQKKLTKRKSTRNI